MPSSPYKISRYTCHVPGISAKEVHPKDITLMCVEDGVLLQSDRASLSARSDYFKHLFIWNQEDTIEVHNRITGNTLQNILNYVHTNGIVIDFDNVTDLLVASNYFMMHEIEDDCIKFILDNLEQSSCIDILLFSLDINLEAKRLKEGCISFICLNFSSFVDNPVTCMQLISLPSQFILEVLKSDDLVTRDEKTGLPTRPVEREKDVLQFILKYAEYAPDSSGMVSSLLSCVKWPVLKVFHQKDFVLQNFATLLDDGKRKDEIKKLLKLRHSKWFVNHSAQYTAVQASFKPAKQEEEYPSLEDQIIYSTRAFTCSELIAVLPLGVSLRRDDTESFCLYAGPDQHLTGLQVVSGDDKVIRGLAIKISPENVHQVGQVCEYAEWFHLQANEHITQVHGECKYPDRSSSSISFLKLESSEGRSFVHGSPSNQDETNMLFKPNMMKAIEKYHEEGFYYPYTQYRNNYGRNDTLYRLNTKGCRSVVARIPHTAHRRDHLDGIVVGVMGKLVNNVDNDVRIMQLSFIFRQLVCSRFLLNSERRYEVCSQLEDSSGSLQELASQDSSLPSRLKKTCSQAVRKLFPK